jgi:hypothetical protein
VLGPPEAHLPGASSIAGSDQDLPAGASPSLDLY